MGKSVHLSIGKRDCGLMLDSGELYSQARGQGGQEGLPSALPALPCVLGLGSLTDQQGSASGRTAGSHEA